MRPRHGPVLGETFAKLGGGANPPISAASNRANSIVIQSSPSAPMIWRPTGRPFSVDPSRADVPAAQDYRLRGVFKNFRSRAETGHVDNYFHRQVWGL
jgi:hypothetical protein